ncbi:MAG: methylmalonyl-CoA mutase family protein [Alphaproteobacteria bacterium]
MRDKPWIFRTYAGHSTASASNALYRQNLSRGQTGLSVAFDLPTQTGYDSDDPRARGEVGKVGVPVSHLGDMRTLFDAITMGTWTTSMTINATAPWLLALSIAVADEQGVPRKDLQGTTQNDIIKEYLSRGTYIYPPRPSLRLTADTIAFTCREMPRWNPVNVCSYHLQEAGATPVQELAYALATATAILDTVKASGQVAPAEFGRIFGRISFFVNAGIRFVTEVCKMRAFTELWEDLGRTRYGVTGEKDLLFRYGVQVNSLGLTEQQPENNVYRILIEMLAVTLSKNARARSVQLPAWNEALGLPRPWDQQWSLRAQQILALETDLLEYGDLFDGSPVIRAKVDELKREALAELERIAGMGGAIAAVETGYIKERLVESNAARVSAIETGEQTVVGVNAYREGAAPALSGGSSAVVTVDASAERDQIERLHAWRATRDASAVATALETLRAAAADGRNIMEPSIACARAGVTTGEWAGALREAFGEFRAPTGVAATPRLSNDEQIGALRERAKAVAAKLGRPPALLVAKPGLDGHSNGAEQIAFRARDCGFAVAYDGIRLTPAEIAAAAKARNPHVIGLSILSGSHKELVAEVMRELKAAGLSRIPVIVGGIVPPEDEADLKALGVTRIYTPKDFDLNAIMGDMLDIVDRP